MRIEPAQLNNFLSSGEGINKRGAAIENMIDKVFETKDSDKDGALSIAELGISDEKFSRIDADSDGLIGVEEMIKPLQALDMMAMQGAQDFQTGNRLEKKTSKVIENRDTDGDGALNIEELGSSEELFSFLDSNEDDLVDQNELIEGMQALKVGPEKQAGQTAEEDSEEESDEVEIIGNGIDDDGDGEVDEIDSNSVFSSSYSAVDLLPSANSSETEDENIQHVDVIA